MPIFQGESSDVSRNEYLCSAIVEDRSLFDNGGSRFSLSFDEHCVMAVDAQERGHQGVPSRCDSIARDRSTTCCADLGKYSGPKEPVAWQKPPSRLGTVLGKLFKVFGR